MTARVLRSAVLAAVAGAAVFGGCRSAHRGTRIVLITLDTLRYDSFRGRPGDGSTMPLTLARAQRGLIFDRFFSASSSTQPSHASLFTGLHPWQHGVTDKGMVLREEYTTVAEVMRGAGFVTSAVVASFPVLPRFGFAQGFETFEATLTEGTRATGEGELEERHYRLAGAVTEAALGQLDRGRGPRQFYWFHYFDPHAPYGDSRTGPTLRPREILEQARAGEDVTAQIARARALYEEDVRSLDGWLDRLFRRLERDQGAYDTHVVVTADHGESFGEDGSLAHGKRLTPGQVHVPAFVVSPRVRAGVGAAAAGSIDIPNTIFSLAGLAARAPGGRDLTSEASARGAAFGMRRAFADGQSDLRLDGRHHHLPSTLFFAVGADGHLYTGNGEGFSSADGGRLPDAAMAGPLRTLFGAFEQQLRGAERTPEHDPEVERALRSLGYLG